MKSKMTNRMLIDNTTLLDLEQSYFICIRSCYLTLRQGDGFIVEPYSPHRFSRQFGFLQDKPGILKFDTREGNSEEGLRYWRLSTLTNAGNTVLNPVIPTSMHTFSKVRYRQWWQKVHGQYVKDILDRLNLLRPDPHAEKPPVKKSSLESKDVASKNTDGMAQGVSPNDKTFAPLTLTGHKRTDIISSDKDETASSSADRHWKRPKVKANPKNPERVNARCVETVTNLYHALGVEEKIRIP